MRKAWDAHFLSIAKAASEMSTCPRANVGAVIVKYNREIATGFNGAPRKEEHCIDTRCVIVGGHCVKAIHAEANALLFAGTDRAEGATMYVTHAPCWACAGLIINGEVTKVVCAKQYSNKDGINRLKKAGIECLTP